MCVCGGGLPTAEAGAMWPSLQECTRVGRPEGSEVAGDRPSARIASSLASLPFLPSSETQACRPALKQPGPAKAKEAVAWHESGQGGGPRAGSSGHQGHTSCSGMSGTLRKAWGWGSNIT